MKIIHLKKIKVKKIFFFVFASITYSMQIVFKSSLGKFIEMKNLPSSIATDQLT